MKWKTILQFTALLVVGFVLIYLSVRKLSIQLLWSTISQGNFIVVIPVFMVSLFGYYIRSLRWRLLLNSMEQEVSVSHLFACLSMGYAVNFATPRFGEVARCLALKKVSKVPLGQALISVVFERIIDVVTLLILIACSIFIYAGETAQFIQQQIVMPITNQFTQSNNQHLVWILAFAVVLCAVCVFLFWRFANRNQWLKTIGDSIASILKLPQKRLFLMYTVIIWTCYFLMTYLWFFTFPQTQLLTLKEAFLIMVVGSIGRSVPIQGGGMGAYHYLVSHALLLFNISLILGNALAFIIHGAQLILTFALGLVCWVWMILKLKNIA